MPLWIVNIALLVCIIASLTSGIWLLLHLPSLARLFRNKGDIVAPPGRGRTSAGKTWLMLIIFNAGWIAAVAIWIWAISGAANQVVDAAI